MPDLIDIQTKSYSDFLQADVEPQSRANKGLQAIFREIFPITSFDGKYTLDFVSYTLEPPKKGYLQALLDGESYVRPLKAKFRISDATGSREEDVFLGDMPIMTPDGAFVVNGAERVIVSQLHRSPGISCEKQVHANGQPLLSVRIIPDRGNWIEFMFDTNDIMWCFMDQRRRRRKFYATTLLRAFGCGSDVQIMKLYYYSEESLRRLVMRDDLVDIASEAVIARRFDPVTPSMMEQVAAAGIEKVEVVDVSFDNGLLIKTLREDAKSGIRNQDDALKEVFRRMRPGDPPTIANAKQLVHRTFHELAHYDLGYVGRHKINKRLGLEGMIDDNLRVLHESGVDVQEADIDHLGNRRIRTTGELLENQCRIGLARTERLVRERMTVGPDTKDGGVLTPQRLVNSKTFSAVIQDFFARSQLSQFMDQRRRRRKFYATTLLRAFGCGSDVQIMKLYYEHRPHLVSRHLRAGQPLRLHRDAVPQGRRRQGDGRDRVPARGRGGAVRHRAGERAAQAEWGVCRGPRDVPLQDRVLRQAGEGRAVHGRRADAGDLHRRRPHPVPRARRRQPRADGREHALKASAPRTAASS